MASTVNVMICHVIGKTMTCVLGMAPVSVGNVSARQTGLVRPVIVHFLRRAVELMKGVKSALAMVAATVAFACVIKFMWENTVKIKFFL